MGGADPGGEPRRPAPAYILVAGHDPLRDQIHAYASKLETAGVPVTLRRFDDQIHGFWTLMNLIDDAAAAHRDAARAVLAAIG